ncbi:ABC transporter permease [Alterinioella nitratireducens]|jgi:ribose transport system permease protein|uniref:ABC transporter permease n=1 Tax=Alterinioella nitratireducens TaxID=2735915 RepID=UPI000C950E22|nr:ABC transporter permease [Alterinioella nitratireducens]MAN14084.1 ribose ABC transporter [Dinoroseobacter sp.]NPD17826.1 ABC transporter permease [Alterinioella nitratireducens]
MQRMNTTDLIKGGAIWGFIVLELVFFSVAGSFWSLSESAFMDFDNMLLLLKQSAPIGIIAVGMTIIMINGNIDLSVGATFALSAVVMLDSMNWPIMAGLGDWAIPVAWLLALLTGAVLGFINGIIVWKTGVDAFIVTLGSMLGFRGLVFMYNGENPTFHLNWTMVDIAEWDALGVETPALVLIAVVVVAWLIMTRTVHGRNAYAIGNNREAAVNAGLRVGPHMLINFVIIGTLAALSAVAFYSASGSVNPNDGMLFELWAITAVVLGGTKLTGGSGSIIGTFGGVIAIQLLRKGLGHIGADTETVNLVIGSILIAVLFLDRQLNRKGQEELKV